jgi:hypothetical protein
MHIERVLEGKKCQCVMYKKIERTNKAITATIGMTMAVRSAPFIFFRPDPQVVVVPFPHKFALLPSLVASTCMGHSY